jgi:trehalose 6-phosphate phosphatase
MPLPEPRTREGAAALQLLSKDPSCAVLGCDFDGTLAAIATRPDDARPMPGAVSALAAAAERLKAVAIVSGRPARQVVELGGLRGVPGLEGLTIFGQYGRERWRASTDEVDAPPVPPGVDHARTEIAELVAAAPSGVTIEDKGSAIVVHVREAADPDAVTGALTPALLGIARNAGLMIEPARLALELRPPGFDKGQALRELVTEYDARAVIFIGDDRGDVPAYDAVDRLRTQGITGVTVASASREVHVLQERADLVVAGPAGVVEFLRWLATAPDG